MLCLLLKTLHIKVTMYTTSLLIKDKIEGGNALVP